MIQTIVIAISPEEAGEYSLVKKQIATAISILEHRIYGFKILKQSIDARGRNPVINMQLEVYVDEEAPKEILFEPELNNVSNARHVIIVGAGPAGLFAALKLISLGVKPIIIERGKDVKSRRRDLAAMNKEGVVNPESNYCFGEGGAGTYSDGKLYTRSTKRGSVQKILQLLVHFGADKRILFEAHPHIGTNKLPQIIETIRKQIIDCGGEVLFETKLCDIILDGGSIKAIKTHKGDIISTDSVILATGHSARDIYELLGAKKIKIEAKPFAIGVRIEHPQEIIDQAQYKCKVRNSFLPPASYSLVTQVNNKGVFSFCMCPGGIIAPAATAPNEIVVNGWSPSKRNNPYANSGTVVSVNENDFLKHGFKGNLAGMFYQKMVEQKAYKYGGGELVAPAQRLVDFTNRKTSSTLPSCSYIPGVKSISLYDVLPEEISSSLSAALIGFGKKMKGYFTNDAIMVATESRTSSPVRIPREKETYQHTQIKGLFPCAEGAGYAGGIVSAAIDGENCALAVAMFLHC
jgi:uncharacterized FAD-dependent dehydrogenase